MFCFTLMLQRLIQAFWTLVLSPVIIAQRGMAGKEIFANFATGWSLLFGTAHASATHIERWVPLFYMIWNIAFNIVAISTLRDVGAATMSLAVTSSVPLAIWIFTLTLPVLGAAPPLGTNFFVGTLALLAGMICYNIVHFRPQSAPA
jgi:hypothetical protein